MATETSTETTPVTTPPVRPAPPASFWRRLQIGTNVLIQVVLLTLIVIAVNGYAYKHFHRFDFSRDRKYALSPRTKQFLGTLN